MSAPRFSDAILARATPEPAKVAAWKGAKMPELAAGLARTAPELRPLHEWALGALGARKKLDAPLGPHARERLQVLIAIAPGGVSLLAAAVALVHGWETVLDAVLAPQPVVALYEHAPTPTIWLADAAAPLPNPNARPRDGDASHWVDALRGFLHQAEPTVRAAARERAAAARPRLPFATRVALARAFGEETWADADGRALLEDPNLVPAHRLQAVLQALLPWLGDDATFAALAPRATSAFYMSSAYAEIAVRPPPARAVQRLVGLLRAPLASEAYAHVRQIVELLAYFDDASAAQAIASAAHLVPDAAKEYFGAHLDRRELLAAAATGRGKPATIVRTILTELDRRASLSAPSAAKLPRCLAEPPWSNPTEPWPARELAVVVDRERIVETPELLSLRSVRYLPQQGGDAAILESKGALDAPRFFGLSDEAALANVARLPAWGLGWALVRFGPRAIEPVASVLTTKPLKTHLAVVEMIRSPRIAAVAWGFHHDEAWLLDDPECSAAGLVPELFALALPRRWSAELGLQRLVVAGYRADVERAAARYGADVAGAVGAILDRDPWTRLPAPLPNLHPKLEDGSLLPLATSEGALPASTTPIVGRLLAASPAYLPHPGIAELRASCTESSRDAFAIELWEKTGSTAGIALLGGDGAVRALDRAMSAKRPEMKPDQRFAAFAVLARVGSPLAIVLLQKHALGSPWPDRNVAIDAHLDELARVRGTTRANLADEAFAGLEVARGPLELDYGARRFTVVLDDHLVPTLRAGDGARVDKLPKPTKKDDAAKAERAKELFTGLVLDLDDVRETVLAWFERGMATERGWDAARFRRSIVGHPLLGQIARRLVFEASGATSGFFRVAEDGSFADADDVTFTVAEGSSVCVAHALRLGPDRCALFQRLFHDYALIQPFSQLDRSTWELTASERDGAKLARFVKRRVAAARLAGLLGFPGWQHGSHVKMIKPLGARTIVLEIAHRGVHARGATAADELGEVTVLAGGAPAPIGALTPVEASELLRDLESLPLA
jgi:hypothetical protein